MSTSCWSPPTARAVGVAVHHDATGRALERAIAYAKSAFAEAQTSLGTTTVAEEVDAELTAREDRAGGHEALLAELDQILVRGTHEPDEAKLGFYERLRNCVAARKGNRFEAHRPRADVEHRRHRTLLDANAGRGMSANGVSAIAGSNQTGDAASARRTGAQIVWEALVREGVKVVFGYPGGAIMPAYDALLQYPIHHVLVRHEQGAAHMADGYARASGEVGVAVATSGPGATNLVTGIATAMLDSVPMVCITAR